MSNGLMWPESSWHFCPLLRHGHLTTNLSGWVRSSGCYNFVTTTQLQQQQKVNRLTPEQKNGSARAWGGKNYETEAGQHMKNNSFFLPLIATKYVPVSCECTGC